MLNHRVVVLQDSEASIDAIKSIIALEKQFVVVGSSTDGEKGLEIIRREKPEFLITGIILKSFDGFAVMDKIRDENLAVKTVIVSSFTSEALIERALSSGAVYYIAKPYKKEILLTRLSELAGEVSSVGTVRSLEKKKSTLDERISKIFISVGIPPHIKGYQYLREGVKMAVDNPEIINNITKQLYPKIGEKYETSASKVERAIRHAIEVAWNRGRIDALNNLLGIRVYMGNDKPTNGEFIALIADKMLLEGA